MSKQHFVIVCIINDGFADEAMDAARAVGARGGTVLSARGTANIEAEKAFHIQIQPEKEMIMILVDDASKTTCCAHCTEASARTLPRTELRFQCL